MLFQPFITMMLGTRQYSLHNNHTKKIRSPMCSHCHTLVTSALSVIWVVSLCQIACRSPPKGIRKTLLLLLFVCLFCFQGPIVWEGNYKTVCRMLSEPIALSSAMLSATYRWMSITTREKDWLAFWNDLTKEHLLFLLF